MIMENKIELLMPAGDLSRLKVALLYGADAVFIGGKMFLSTKSTFKNIAIGTAIVGAASITIASIYKLYKYFKETSNDNKPVELSEFDIAKLLLEITEHKISSSNTNFRYVLQGTISISLLIVLVISVNLLNRGIIVGGIS